MELSILPCTLLLYSSGDVHGPSKLWGSSSKNEFQCSLDVPSGRLQCSKAQLVILYPHVPQLLKLRLPLVLKCRDIGGLQSLLQGLTEYVVTDGRSRRHA